MNTKTITILRNLARSVLIIITASFFVFALLSGAEPGLAGIIKNSPNALPWLLLFILVGVVWQWELIGGIIILLLGVFSFFFFNAVESMVVLLLAPVPLVILGIIFIISSKYNN